MRLPEARMRTLPDALTPKRSEALAIATVSGSIH